MTSLQEFIVIVWLIPVLLHIVLPLAALVVYLILRPFGLLRVNLRAENPIRARQPMAG